MSELIIRNLGEEKNFTSNLFERHVKQMMIDISLKKE
jgi:hypothetical protein